MTPDLRSALEGFGHEESRGSDLSAAGLDAEVRALTARVRRRRALRATAAGLGAATVMGVGALGVQAADRTDEVPVDPRPSVTRTSPAPSPSVTRTGTPAPTPTPTSEEPAVLGEVTVHPLLPPAQPLRAGMLEAAGPGWHLVTVSVPWEVEPDVPDAPPPVLYLVSPSGDRFEVPTPVPLTIDSATWDGGTVEDWAPGSTAVVTFVSTGVSLGDTRTGYLAVRDLLSGETFAEIPVPETEWVGATFVGDGTTDVLVTRRVAWTEGYTQVDRVQRLTRDGVEVGALGAMRQSARSDEAFVRSPDGSTLVLNDADGLRLVRTRDLAVIGDVTVPYPDAPGACGVWTWWDDDRVVLRCQPDGPSLTGEAETSELWLAPASGDAPARRLGDAQSYVGATMVAGRLVVLGTPSWTAVDESGTVTTLPWSSDLSAPLHGTAGDRVHVRRSTAAGGQEIVSVDPFTGQVAQLVPPVTSLDLRVAPTTARG
ncbi:hypothetical protein [Cellulomonas sp. NS3]|uniref:hypothetical protein n=1 Tax=Cellulomonas sp. NS3 TaxID=2973977 RepID=UPI0021622219|nr:hypothetical protein [Cellulomonas sp. NS3]